VTAYKDGEAITVKPASYRKVVDFGQGLGSKEVFLYNLPEVYSAHTVMGIPSTSARFGTSPGIFNTLMAIIADKVPASVLADENAVKPLVRTPPLSPLCSRAFFTAAFERFPPSA
jgi:hypothetical protein